MVWRIHFTVEDVERIQVKPTLGPLAETIEAMTLLRDARQRRVAFSQWRSQVTGRLTAEIAPLASLIPPGSLGVDLLTLTGPATTIEQGVQALLAMPREHLLAEMEATDRMDKLPAAAWPLADQEGRVQLAEAARAAHQAMVEPYWPRIGAVLHAEHIARSRTLAAGGPGRLLASLQGRWTRWRPPVLEVLGPDDFDMHLGGRGIALMPSVFVGQLPTLAWDPNRPEAPPWLIVSTPDDRIGRCRLWDKAQPDGAALAALVGKNRAAVLRTVADGCTTTELADRVGISLAAASQHASVLRDAGLITTRRQGSAVLHILTPLGAELLRAGLGPDPAPVRVAVVGWPWSAGSWPAPGPPAVVSGPSITGDDRRRQTLSAVA
jgi:DNA-binding transcriptional ArsR family regulator